MLTQISWSLIILSIAFTSIYHTFLIVSYRRTSSSNSLNIDVIDGENIKMLSIIIPSKNEPLDVVIESFKNLINLINKEMEFKPIYIFDDDLNYIYRLIENVEAIPGVVILRSNLSGRNSAINDGVKFSYEDNIMVLDIDCKIDEEIIRYAKKCNDVCVFPWRPYVKYNTFIEQTMDFMTSYGTWIYYIVRNANNLHIFPLGSGTVYSRELFMKIGMLPNNIIQDDIYLGLKLLENGISPKLINRNIYVTVPSTLEAARIQQCRWAYGAIQLLRLFRFKSFVKSPYTYKKKIEAFTYIFQPFLTLFYTIGIAIAFLAGLVEKSIYLAIMTPFLIFFVLPLFFEVMNFVLFVRDSNYSNIKRALFLIGRTSALTNLLAIFESLYVIGAILNIKIPYRITPKSLIRKGIDLAILTSLVLGITLTFISLYTCNRGVVLIGVMQILTAAYSIIRFK